MKRPIDSIRLHELYTTGHQESTQPLITAYTCVCVCVCACVCVCVCVCLRVLTWLKLTFLYPILPHPETVPSHRLHLEVDFINHPLGAPQTQMPAVNGPWVSVRSHWCESPGAWDWERLAQNSGTLPISRELARDSSSAFITTRPEGGVCVCAHKVDGHVQ